MPEFFHGWRRKVGCSLLLVAIGLCTLWARSELVEDNLSIPSGDRRHLVTLPFWACDLGNMGSHADGCIRVEFAVRQLRLAIPLGTEWPVAGLRIRRI